MGSRPPTLVTGCVVAAAVAAANVAGFGLLLVGREIVDSNLRLYLRRNGFSARNAEYDEWGLVAAEFVSGAAVSVAVAVLAVLTLVTLRDRLRVLTMGAAALALPWALLLVTDGSRNVPPGDLVAEVYPAWFFPLQLGLGVVALPTYLAVIVLLGLPRSALPVRTGTSAASSAWSPTGSR